MRPTYFQWIPTKLTSSSTSSYSTPASVSIPLQFFLGSLSTAHFPFLNKALRCISASSRGPFEEFLYFLYKGFLRLLFTFTSPSWFPFQSVTNITKLERLHRAASHTITGCLSSSPIPLLSEASLPPLRVTLAHFTLSSHEWALRLPTSFLISGFARLGVKPRFYRSFLSAFSSTHQLMLPPTSPRKALLARPPSPPWNRPSFPPHALALIPFSLVKVRSSSP